MAAQTAFLIHQRPVNPVFVEGVAHHGAVAASAEFITSLFCFKRSGRGRRFVALGTAFIGNRSMYIVKEDPCFIRTMGIMAGGTVSLRDRIIHMLLDKGRAIRFVAFHA